MQENKVDLLIIIPPAGFKNSVYPPYGAMYIASALRQKGYNPEILDVDAKRITNKEVIDEVRCINPRYLGISGIVAPSYRYVKDLSLNLRSAFPDKKQILGGGLSSAADVVLNHTAVDIVVRGEGDLTIIELMECLGKDGDLRTVSGIHFKEEGNCLFTGSRKLVAALDTLPYPAFDLVEMDKYLMDGIEYMKKFVSPIKDKKVLDRTRKQRMMTMPTSRGCFGRCSFCFRAYPGLRLHSMKYVFDLIEYCIEKFNVGFFSFGDECFAINKARNWEFIEEYKKRKLDIVFKISGMRVDTVDKDILRAYKEIGCWMIEYGFESGSQRMLNIINKGVTVEQNREAALWTEEAGIFTSPAIILGMPGETEETIDETISFLKSLNFKFKQYQWKYAIPIPGSALYDFAKLTGAIEDEDEDEYLVSLEGEAESGGLFNINVTEQPDAIVTRWDSKLKATMDAYFLEKKYKNVLVRRFMQLVYVLQLHHRRRGIIFAVKQKIRKLLTRFFGKKEITSRKSAGPRFRKKKEVVIDTFLEGLDLSRLNRKGALSNINIMIRQNREKEAERSVL